MKHYWNEMNFIVTWSQVPAKLAINLSIQTYTLRKKVTKAVTGAVSFQKDNKHFCTQRLHIGTLVAPKINT